MRFAGVDFAEVDHAVGLARVREQREDQQRGEHEQVVRREQSTDRVRRLALDGAAVMKALGRGPGRHIGDALAHLAALVVDDPSLNTRERLEGALQAWADANPEG